MSGKEVGEEIITELFNPRPDITIKHILASRSNYLVESNLTQLLSIVFPSDMTYDVFNADGTKNEAATQILTNMAKKPSTNLWYFMQQTYDDIFTYGALVANKFYQQDEGVWVLHLRRLPPETFSETPSEVKGTSSIFMPGLISTSKGIRAFQTSTDDTGNTHTVEIPEDSLLIFTDPRYASKVGGESKLKSIVPLLQNLNDGYVMFKRASRRAGDPKVMVKRPADVAKKLTPEERNDLKKFLSDQTENGAVLLPDGMDAQGVPINANNMCERYLTVCIQQIKDFFNPTSWLSSTGTALSESGKARLELIKLAVAGQQSMVEDHIEGVLNEWLEINGWTGCTVTITINNANVSNEAAQAKIVETLRKEKLCFINEGRQIMGLPALDEEQLKLLEEEYGSSNDTLASLLTFGPEGRRLHSNHAGISSFVNVGEEHEPNRAEAILTKELVNVGQEVTDSIVSTLTDTGVDRQRIDTSIGMMERRTVVSLSQNAGRQYAIGSTEAYTRMQMVPDGLSIMQRTQAFTEDYVNLAIKEGVTIIDGEKNNWISRFQEEQRVDIYDIITKGMEEGKYPGVKEGVRGGYAQNTIGYDLQEYFNDRRSHTTTVARTESGRIMNMGHLETYAEMGVTRVRVLDGDGANSCDVCNMINGQEWPVDYAMDHTLEHPNCVRDFIPIKPRGGYAVNNIPVKLFKERQLLLKMPYQFVVGR